MSDRNSTPDLILRGGKVTTLDRANPLAAAVSISNGKFVSMVAQSKTLQSAAGYIDARPQRRQIDQTFCDARPDHTFWSNKQTSESQLRHSIFAPQILNCIKNSPRKDKAKRGPLPI